MRKVREGMVGFGRSDEGISHTLAIAFPNPAESPDRCSLAEARIKFQTL